MLCGSINLNAAVTYKLSYNSLTQVYTVSFNSTVAYTGGLARIAPSTQFTIVVPDPDGSGTGAFTVVNLTPMTALNWGVTQLNSPVENPTKDYLFFSPSNGFTIQPLDIFLRLVVTLTGIWQFDSGDFGFLCLLRLSTRSALNTRGVKICFIVCVDYCFQERLHSNMIHIVVLYQNPSGPFAYF